MTVASATALFAVMLVLSFAPGPTEIALVARSITSGAAHGVIMIFGIVFADFLFIMLAVVGLAAIAEAVGPLFLFVKYSAGVYLVVLGIRQLRTRVATIEKSKSIGASRASSFLSGLFLTLGDPKAIVGYMSLLPAFVDLSHVSIRDAATIMLLATVAIVCAKTCYVALAERSARQIESSQLKTWLNILAGIVLAGTGIFVISQGYLASQA
jgi:threonine/homoserine/homoserine lactone efflux protein